MKITKLRFLLALLIVLSSQLPDADARQSLPAGYPVVTSYDHRNSYTGTGQAYNIAEDDRGIIYFGNHIHGIQVFNGNGWDRIHLGNNRGAISLLWHPDEKRMYFSSDFTFGYLEVNESNEFVPVHLSEYLEPDEIIKERYWMMRHWNDKILIKSSRQLLSWDGSEIEILFQSDKLVNRLHVTGDAYWFHVEEHGMYRGDENGIAPFALETPDGNPYAIGVFDSDEGITFVTQSTHIIHYNGAQFTFGNNEQPMAPGQPMARVIRTSSGAFALVDGQTGVRFFHPDGSPDVHMTEAHGLPTNRKAFLFEDSSGKVWAGGGLGVSVIEYASPLRILSGEQQVPPGSEALLYFQGELFAGGSTLFKWDDAQQSWAALSDLPNRIMNMQTDGNSLIAAGQAGLLQYQNGVLHHPYRFGTYEIAFSERYDDLVFVIGSTWLKFFLTDETGLIQRKIHEIDFEAIGYSVHEDTQGRIWIGTGNRGIIRITYSREGNTFTTDEFRRFGTDHGFPPGNFLYTFKAKDTVFFTTSEQYYAFDEASETFFPYLPFEKPFDFHIKTPWPTVADHFNRLWLDLNGAQLGFLDLSTEPPHEWTFMPFRRHAPFLHIQDFVIPSENEVYTISDFTASRFDLTKLDLFPRTGSAIISEVTLGTDSLLSGQAGPIVRTREAGISHTREPIRFNWGSTSHLPVRYRRFQTKLEGFDREWTVWNDETRREYTNLPAGTYTFIVRTRDVYTRVGDEARFTFTILPPWYATVWAYLMYVIFFAGFMLFLVRWRTASLEKKKEALEITISERTKEIEAKKQKAEEDRILIEKQAEKLREEKQLRSRLFANIAHEFRTPITISQGLVEKIDRDSITEPEDKTNMQVVRRNIRRLSNMIDQVIDVTKLDNQILQLRPKVLLAGPLMRRIAESFRSLTDAKKQIYKIDPCETDLRIQTDPDKLETILNNLIFNAIKFTPEEGIIQVTGSREEGRLVIRVSDTGPGIPDDQAESVFNRFHRIRNENLPYQEGMGIGLELSRSLAKAMEGDLYLETGRRKGSCFVLRLPEYTGEALPEPDQWEEPLSRSQLDLTGLSILAENQPEQVSGKILLVEDNKDMQAYVAGILSRLGEVRICENGLAALELLKTWEPDLIISDLMMPELDGYGLVQALEKQPRLREIPVIILTAKPFLENKLSLLRAGVIDYITKPFNAEELLLRSGNALKTYSSRKEIRVAMKLDADTDATEEVRGHAERAAAYIRAHISDENLKTDLIADALNMSRSTLVRAIKAESGMTPAQFIKEIRLQYARQLILNNPGISKEETAEAVGFQKASWFVKLFEERFGVKPGELG
ncbi:MAG: response regulator [Balneolales bacterium]|nr:response regulator [Balneolales bacterium]